MESVTPLIKRFLACPNKQKKKRKTMGVYTKTKAWRTEEEKGRKWMNVSDLHAGKERKRTRKRERDGETRRQRRRQRRRRRLKKRRSTDLEKKEKKKEKKKPTVSALFIDSVGVSPCSPPFPSPLPLPPLLLTERAPQRESCDKSRGGTTGVRASASVFSKGVEVRPAIAGTSPPALKRVVVAVRVASKGVPDGCGLPFP